MSDDVAGASPAVQRGVRPHGTRRAGIETAAWADAGSNRVTRNLRPDWFGAEELVRRSEVDALLAVYEQCRADELRLVRELDVLLNGEEGAARQASLCDIVSQVRMLVTPA